MSTWNAVKSKEACCGHASDTACGEGGGERERERERERKEGNNNMLECGGSPKPSTFFLSLTINMHSP